MTIKQTLDFAVEQKIDGKWLNMWTSETDTGTVPLTFTTLTEAAAELDTFRKEIMEQTGVPIIESDFRVAEYLVYEPAPLYEVGYRFQVRMNGVPVDMILTNRYESGDVWKYHLGMVMEDPGSCLAHTYKCGDVDFIDYTTISEYQVAGSRIPGEGDPQYYVLTRGAGHWQEWWNDVLNDWVNRDHATPYVVVDKSHPKAHAGRWEKVE